MARRKTIKPIDLSATVDAILAEYGDEVFDVLGVAIKETSEEARDELKSVKFKTSGIRHPQFAPYSSTWTYAKRNVTRTKTETVVYNQDNYRLTHLLENGHALKRGGRVYGRVQAYPHIKPVNDKAQDNVVRKVEEMISKI